MHIRKSIQHDNIKQQGDICNEYQKSKQQDDICNEYQKI